MEFRRATLRDAEQIYELSNYYAEKGKMLTRSRHQIYESVRDFEVAADQGKIVAVGALHIVWLDLAEVRTLAVAPQYLRRGIARRIVENLIAEGRFLGVKKFFALTYQPEFFSACGFAAEDKNNMPQKVWMDCVNCPKFPNCDEICMALLI
ncbi:MAG: N-acetyltransferase [Peptococcaceae bacterium]|jgi:amino-acid N-acetyltransferase|nr:N-acetyltransferase [Peptococcaceae bacterium]